jgi:hypothetical protein
MKRVAAVLSIGVLVAFPMKAANSKSLGESLIKPGGSPPVITHWFASKELSHGDIWKIYVEAHDPDGDMRQFVCAFTQIAHGPYSSEYVIIKKRHRERMKGYLRFPSYVGAGRWLPEWTELSLTIYIRDKGGNTSNKVVFPLVLSRGAKQGTPPPPFDIGELDKLGTIPVELIDPERGNGDGDERQP